MRIRLHGTAQEIDRTLTALQEVLDIRSISRPYADRPPSVFLRVYLDAGPNPHRTTAP